MVVKVEKGIYEMKQRSVTNTMSANNRVKLKVLYIFLTIGEHSS